MFAHVYVYPCKQWLTLLPNLPPTGEKYKNDEDNLAAAVDSVGGSLASEDSYKNASN